MMAGQAGFGRSLALFPSFWHSQKLPQAALEDDFRRRLTLPVQPIFKVVHFDNMGHFRLLDRDADGRQAFADFSYPVVAAKRDDALSDRFVKSACCHVQ